MILIAAVFHAVGSIVFCLLSYREHGVPSEGNGWHNEEQSD
jgi:hypothetical protein